VRAAGARILDDVIDDLETVLVEKRSAVHFGMRQTA